MDPTHCNPANETTWEYFDPSKPLYEMYKPKPWRIAQVESQRAGNMLAVMEPIEKTGELGAFTLPPQDVHAWTDAEVASEFHRRWYNSRSREDSSSYCCNYGGRIIDKTPLDLWRYVEIIERVHPRVLIESGTANGASAQFFLDQMRRHLHPVEVISIDTDDGLAPFEQNPSRSNPGVRPLDDGIVYLLGSSTDKQIAMECRNRSVGRQTMVVLDSDHSCAHVELEMSVYWPLVSDGSYMVVEDSNINGNPVYPEYGPGPHEAVARWLPGHEDAFIDIEISRRFLGVSAHTWIKKVRT
jgi:cephalosporin hydroxylase